MDKIVIIFTCSVLMMTSCISSRKFSDMEVLKEYYKLKGDTLEMVQRENVSLKRQLNKSNSDLGLTEERLSASQAALTGTEERYDQLNRNYAKLQAESEQLSATKNTEAASMKGQIQQLKSQNETMKSILTNLDRSYQIDLNGAVLANDTWNQKLSRMQELSEVINAEYSQILGLYEVLSASAIFQEEGIQVLQSADGITMQLQASKIFRTGKSQLNTKGRNTVKEITGMLIRNSNLDIRVTGHTDNQGSDNSNWNMSVMRASAVVKEMIKNEMRPTRVLAMGRSSHRPIAFEDTEAARSLNRRVEIILRPRSYR